MSEEKVKCYRLYWLCSQSGRSLPAGVGFYNESKGDYRLSVDVFCENKIVFLRPISMTDGMINFRVESAIKKKSGIGVHHRAEIGVGHANAKDGFPIYMDIGPYDRTLVMEAAA